MVPLDQTQVTEDAVSRGPSSGVGVTSLSVDPVGASGENVLLNQIQRDDSFTQTTSLVQGRLQVGIPALGSVVSPLTQAISLATANNNGSPNSSQLQAIGNQLAGIRDEVTRSRTRVTKGSTFLAAGRHPRLRFPDRT